MLHCTGLLPSPPAMHASPVPVTSGLPDVPKNIGNPDLIPADGWGMLGNRDCGDCGIAGPMHTEMYWAAVAGKPVRFTDLDAKQDYGALTGYPLHDPGIDMMRGGSYWQHVGFRDATATRHKIVAYRSIEGSFWSRPNLQHVLLCTSLFGATGIGVRLPDSVATQFGYNKIWEPVSGAKDTKEYHFVAVLFRCDGLIGIISWGRLCWMTESFFEKYCLEATAYLRDANDPHAGLFKAAA